MLKQAWAVARTEDANLFGVEIAIVTNVQDPDKQGRVKICFPRLPGKPESDWARVAQPAAGDGRGFYCVPQVNDEVLVAFERGQANHPYVIGSVWNGKDKPMKDAYADENTTVMVQTRSGHQVILCDKDGEESIVIADKSGKRAVTWNVKDKKFLIEAKEGDVEFHAEKKIVISCEDLEIKTSKTGKIGIGKTFDLKVAQKAGFKAGPQMNMKADKVNLNPPSLDLAALVAAALAKAAAAAAAAAGANAEQQQQAAAAAPRPGRRSRAARRAATWCPPRTSPAPPRRRRRRLRTRRRRRARAGCRGPTGPSRGRAGRQGRRARPPARAEFPARAAIRARVVLPARRAPQGRPAPRGRRGRLRSRRRSSRPRTTTSSSASPTPRRTRCPTSPTSSPSPTAPSSRARPAPAARIEARGLEKGGDYKLAFPDVDKGGSAPPQQQDKPPAASGNQLAAGMLGAACFAGLVPGALTSDEEQFILSLKGRHANSDEQLKLVRLVFKAYRNLGCAAPAAAGMSSQFVIESDWGRALTGKFNYFGIKSGKKGVGTLCTTTEHNLSDAAVEQLQADGRYIGADPPDEKGTVVHHIKDWFADYTSLDNALQRKVDLLHKPTYEKHQVLESPAPEDFCKRIKEAGYATAVNYTNALIARLKLVDGYAKKKKGKTVEIVQATANADVDPARFDGGFP